MVCLGLEPGVAGWKAQMNPLSYGGTPNQSFLCHAKIRKSGPARITKSCKKIFSQSLRILVKEVSQFGDNNWTGKFYNFGSEIVFLIIDKFNNDIYFC